MQGEIEKRDARMKMTDARSEIREDANDEVRASEKILSIIWGNLMKF